MSFVSKIKPPQRSQTRNNAMFCAAGPPKQGEMIVWVRLIGRKHVWDVNRPVFSHQNAYCIRGHAAIIIGYFYGIKLILNRL